jgi:hypothetical protein
MEPAVQESVSKELMLDEGVLENIVVLDKGDTDRVDDEDERTIDTIVDDLVAVEDLVELDPTALLLVTPHFPNPA